tara:strand:+ start:14173 stop:15738 length:1566 start_codon:yes stop_codon:yes gene_type:complete
VIVLEQTKELALKLRDPDKVTEMVSGSRVTAKGATIVPHTVDAVHKLRGIGINAPSPILHHYSWPSKYTPYNHQRLTAAFLTVNPKALVLNEIGTGKTQSALWAADYLISVGEVSKVLIISPLSTLERVWGDAIREEANNRQPVVLTGTKERRRKRLNADAEYYIINHEGFSLICDDAVGKFDLVIVDEAAVLRNPSTTKFRTLYKWMSINPDTRLWLMTGTPTPNLPTDAWALAKLVGNPMVYGSNYRTFTSFKDLVMRRERLYTWVPRADSMDVVKNVLQPCVRYARDECFDLPDTVSQTREVKMTPEQVKHYKSMMKTLITESETEGTITAVNEAIKIQKLVQIACGVAYNDEGECVELDCAPRVNATKEVIREAGGKIILFVPLTGTLHMLHRELSKHWTVGVVNGSVSPTKRNVIFDNFQNATDPKILLAHPATMAHGLTLTSASTVVWYGPITSNEQYVQANGRIERIGKKHSSNVVHIEATQIEQRMYDRLARKQKMQGLLLDMIRLEMEKNNG